MQHVIREKSVEVEPTLPQMKPQYARCTDLGPGQVNGITHLLTFSLPFHHPLLFEVSGTVSFPRAYPSLLEI